MLLRNHLQRAVVSPGLIVVAAFALRMGLLFHFHIAAPIPVLTNVPIGYETGRVAQAIALGQGFSSPLAVDTGPTAWFTPVYPYLLAGVFKVFGIFTYASHVMILTLNCIFSALVCVPLFYLGRRAFSPAVGALSAWLWVFLPHAVLFPLQWVWDTSLSALLMALLFWATLELRTSNRAVAWAGYGALWAMAGLTNPSLLSLLPFLLGWVALRAQREKRQWAKLGGVASLVFLAGVFPWSVRNYRVFGQVVLFRSNLGLELYVGNNPKEPTPWSPDLHPNDNPEEREKFRQMGEITYVQEKQHEAIQFILSHPRDFARSVFLRFAHTWTGIADPVADIWPTARWDLKALLVINCLFSLSSFLGVFLAIRQRNAYAVPFALVPLIFPVVYYITHTTLRYRHPIDPILAVLAVSAVAYPVSVLRRRYLPGRTRGVSPHAAPEEVGAAR